MMRGKIRTSLDGSFPYPPITTASEDKNVSRCYNVTFSEAGSKPTKDKFWPGPLSSVKQRQMKH